MTCSYDFLPGRVSLRLVQYARNQAPALAGTKTNEKKISSRKWTGFSSTARKCIYAIHNVTVDVAASYWPCHTRRQYRLWLHHIRRLSPKPPYLHYPHPFPLPFPSPSTIRRLKRSNAPPYFFSTRITHPTSDRNRPLPSESPSPIPLLITSSPSSFGPPATGANDHCTEFAMRCDAC